MQIEISHLHNVMHHGMNRLEALCKKMFYYIPQMIIRKVVTECLACQQAVPLKKT